MDAKNWNWHGRFLKYQHKYWELDIAWLSPQRWTEYFAFALSATRRTDHAGLRISLGVMRFNLEFQIYDSRHWNYELGRWNRYGRTDTELDYWL